MNGVCNSACSRSPKYQLAHYFANRGLLLPVISVSRLEEWRFRTSAITEKVIIGSRVYVRCASYTPWPVQFGSWPN